MKSKSSRSTGHRTVCRIAIQLRQRAVWPVMAHEAIDAIDLVERLVEDSRQGVAVRAVGCYGIHAAHRQPSALVPLQIAINPGYPTQARQSRRAPVTQAELNVRRAPLVMRNAVVVNTNRGYSAAMQLISTSELPGIPPRRRNRGANARFGHRSDPRNTSFIAGVVLEVVRVHISPSGTFSIDEPGLLQAASSFRRARAPCAP